MKCFVVGWYYCKVIYMGTQIVMCNPTNPGATYKNVTGISVSVNLSMYDVTIFGFVRNIVIFMGFFATVPVFKCVETFYFFPRLNMLIGYTNVQYPKCNRPCVVELLRHSRRKGVISIALLPLFL